MSLIDPNATKEIIGDWYITCRPKTIDEVYFHEPVKKFFKECQSTNSFPRAVLLNSGFGQGKTTIAKLIALNLACKHKNEKNEPCLKCPSCNSILNETWDRDVLLVNATVEGGKDDIENIVDGFMSSPAIRDANKVLIIDEAQALTSKGVSVMLKVLESPRKGQYTILTSMDKMQGNAAKALESRCKKWVFKTPGPVDIYKYMGLFVGSHKDLIDMKEAPLDFWTKGLELISLNAEGSFRKAIQILEQCYKGRLFDLEEIKHTFELTTQEDIFSVLSDLSHGRVDSPIVFDTITGKAYQDNFNLIIKVISDAEVVKAFGKLSADGFEWQSQKPKEIASGQFYNITKEAFKKLSYQQFIKRGEWQLILAELVNEIRRLKQASVQREMPGTPIRRRVPV